MKNVIFNAHQNQFGWNYQIEVRDGAFRVGRYQTNGNQNWNYIFTFFVKNERMDEFDFEYTKKCIKIEETKWRCSDFQIKQAAIELERAYIELR